MKTFENLSKWISEKSTGKITILFLVLFLVFTSTVLPNQSNKAAEYSEGVGTIDLSLWYTADEVYEMAEAYGEVGRKAYIQARLSFDVIWPIIYMLFLSSSISYIFSKGFSIRSNFQKLNLIPVLGLIFDYFENGLASCIMYRFPSQISLSNFLPVFTLLKWICVGGSFVLLILGLLALFVKLIKKS